MSTTEILFRSIEVALTLIGLVLVVFGWIIPYKNSIKAEEIRARNELEMERIRWEKELIDKQISNLYGPIYALINERYVTFSIVLYQLGRQYVIPEGMGFYDLSENEQKIWKHYVDNYAIPNQMRIVDIMRGNLHLVYKSEIPACYRKFLDYALGLDLLDKQKRSDVPNFYEYHYAYNYPSEFNYYIRTTLNLLLKEQAELMEQTEKFPVPVAGAEK